MEQYINIKEIMKLPIYEREEAAEKAIKGVVGKFDIKWTDYLTHKEIIKVINNGGKLEDIYEAVEAAKKLWKFKHYVIAPTVTAIVFCALIALWIF